MDKDFDYKDIMIPADIEKKSFEIITNELGDRTFDPEIDPVVKRVIHATADFDYADNLSFSEHAVRKMQNAIRNGASIVTDTNMAKAGIHKKKLAEFGGEVYCYMADSDVAEEAKKRSITRAAVSMEKAAGLGKNIIFVSGNAPTALMKIYELLTDNKLIADSNITDGRSIVSGIIAVPVGFVHVVEAKELILETKVPHIVARGRKGGSNVAAAIVNAILYSM